MLFFVFLIALIGSYHCKEDNPIILPPPAEDTTFNPIINPFWSHDGNKILFIGGIFGREGDGIYEVDTSGGTARIIFIDTLSKMNPKLSPDGKLIAYLANKKHLLLCCAQVWVVNIDGTNPRLLTPFGGNWENLQWSLNSRYLIFNGDVEDSGEIHNQIVRVDIETGEAKLLTQGHYGNGDASFTYDGEKIVYYSERIYTDYGGKVFLMNPDGSDPVPIDTTRKASAAPRPSPARNELLFRWGLGWESDDGSFLVNIDSTFFPALPESFRFFHRYGFSRIKWSPDGNSLVYPFRVQATEGALYIINRDGKNERRLTYGLNVHVVHEYPWSPDSKKLVFTAEDIQTDSSHVYIYDLQMNTTKRLFIKL